MTFETQEIAAIVDRFPKEMRKRFLRQVVTLAEIYRASGVRESHVARVPAPKAGRDVPSNVIFFESIRQR